MTSASWSWEKSFSDVFLLSAPTFSCLRYIGRLGENPTLRGRCVTVTGPQVSQSWGVRHRETPFTLQLLVLPFSCRNVFFSSWSVLFLCAKLGSEDAVKTNIPWTQRISVHNHRVRFACSLEGSPRYPPAVGASSTSFSLSASLSVPLSPR